MCRPKPIFRAVNDLNHQLFIRPAHWDAWPGVRAAQSTRHGGVSPPPFDALNLGLYTQDYPSYVSQNRLRFFGALGIPLERTAGAQQIHGKEVLYVQNPGQYSGFDALITDIPELYLTVTTADCNPILIYDTGQRAVAAIHAGWKGTALEIARHALRNMQDRFGTDPARCHAWMGACIGADEYEVNADVAEQFPEAFRPWDAGRSKYLLDLHSANRAQLEAGGVPAGQISRCPYTTMAHEQHFFSHRASAGHTGRMLAVIGLKAE
jgi:hypothetical protein